MVGKTRDNPLAHSCYDGNNDRLFGKAIKTKHTKKVEIYSSYLSLEQLQEPLYIILYRYGLKS